MRISLYEAVIERLIRVTGILVILFLASIFLFLLREGGATFFEVPIRDLLRTRCWQEWWSPWFSRRVLIAGSQNILCS